MAQHPGRHPSLLYIKKNNVATRRKIFEQQATIEEEDFKNGSNSYKHSSHDILRNSINKTNNGLSERKVNIATKARENDATAHAIRPAAQKRTTMTAGPRVPITPPSLKPTPKPTLDRLIPHCESHHKEMKGRPKTVVSWEALESAGTIETPNLPPKPPRVLSGSTHKSPSTTPLYELLTDTHSHVLNDESHLYHVLEPLHASKMPSRSSCHLEMLLDTTVSDLETRSSSNTKMRNVEKPPIYCTVANDGRYRDSLNEGIRNKQRNLPNKITTSSNKPFPTNKGPSFHTIEQERGREPEGRGLQPDERGYSLPIQECKPQKNMGSHSWKDRSLLKAKMDLAYSILRPPYNQQVSNSTEDLTAGEHHLKRLEHVRYIQKQKAVSKEGGVIGGREGATPHSLIDYSLIVTLKSLNKHDDIIKYEADVIFEWPSETSEEEKSVKFFCFPDLDSITPTSPLPEEVFSFVLTSSCGHRKYCWCLRYSLPGNNGLRHEAVCVVSKHDEMNIFHQLLHRIRSANEGLARMIIIEASRHKLPRVNKEIHIKTTSGNGSRCSLVLKRPPEDKHTTMRHGVLVAKLPMGLLVQVLASLLLERKLILIADKISTLSSCISSLCYLLYPFSWPHTIITALPLSLCELIDSPSPYILGILSSNKQSLNDFHLDDVLVVNVDGGFFVRWVGDEASILPKKIQKALLSALSNAHQDEEAGKNGLTDVIIGESFLRMFVELCGHYRSFMHPSGFKREDFVKYVPVNSMRLFLDWFSRTCMFQIFVSNKGKSSRSYDVFEQRIDEYQSEVDLRGNKSINKDTFVNFFKGKLVKTPRKT